MRCVHYRAVTWTLRHSSSDAFACVPSKKNKRVVVEAVRQIPEKWVEVWSVGQTAAHGGGCKWVKLIGGAEGGRTPDLRIAN